MAIDQQPLLHSCLLALYLCRFRCLQRSRIGFEKWREYVKLFGLGRKLGVDLPNEINGNVPSIEWYDRVYGSKRWKYSNAFK